MSVSEQGMEGRGLYDEDGQGKRESAAVRSDYIGSAAEPPVSPVVRETEISDPWDRPLETLRRKWSTIPLSDRREQSGNLLRLSDEDLLAAWQSHRDADSRNDVRGWYRLLYREAVQDKKILDIGCGFAFDSISFGQQGAELTLVDIVEDNVLLAERVAALLGVKVQTHFLSSVELLDHLDTDYDVVMAIGSLHNAPQEVMRSEYQALTRRLHVGGRWWQLAYPRTRWLREGEYPFDEWGPMVDGPGTPWEEWYDVPKLLDLLAPATFDLVLYTEWHNVDFNWFDLVKTSEGHQSGS